MASVIVTGAEGFIGKSLVKYLWESGYTVIGTSRNPENINDISKRYVHEWIKCDFDDSTEVEADKIRKADYLVHLAGLAHATGISSYKRYHDINVKGTELLLDIAAGSNLKRFVFLSTIKVISGDQKKNPTAGVVEHLSSGPDSFYGQSKLEAENQVRVLASGYNIRYTILRPPLVFGPGVKANFLSLLKILKLGIPLPLGSVETARSLIYVDNLSGIIEKCMVHPAAAGQTYVVKDITLSVPSLIKQISHLMGHKPLLFPFPVKLLRLAGIITGKSSIVDALTGSLEINDDKIRKELDWSSEISFDEALKETVNWYLEEYKDEH